MCQQDLTRLRELLAPDVRYHIPQSSVQLRPPAELIGSGALETHDPYTEGRDARLAMERDGVNRFFAEAQPPEFVLLTADGDAVTAVVRVRARLRDGTPYENLYCWPMRIEGGQVVEMWEVHDTAYAFPLLLRQLSSPVD
jgi:ketosteroid isomerase-like protein